MAFLDVNEAGEIGDIAIHTVETFGDDQHIAIVSAFFTQQMIQVIEVVVAELHRLGGGAFSAAHDAVMRQFVEKQSVARTHDMGNHGNIGEIAADQCKSSLGADKGRKGGFEFLMGGSFTPNEAGGEGAYAKRGQGLCRGCLYGWVSCEPEIIVIRKAYEITPARLGGLPHAVGCGEKGIPLFEIGFSGKTEAFSGVVTEIIDLRHEYPRSFKEGRMQTGEVNRLRTCQAKHPFVE